MNEFVKSLRNFLARDLLYIIGGTCVIASFLYLFDRLPEEQPPIPYLVILAGVAYAIGYAVQDSMSFLPIVTSRHIDDPGKLSRCYYWCFTRREWMPVSERVDFPKDYYRAVDNMSEREIEEFRRLITLKHIGTSIGSNLLVAFVFLFARYFSAYEEFDAWIAFFSLVLSIFLIVQSWVKGLQQTQFVTMVLEEENTNQTA